jgi:hypothetical protein
MWPFTNRRAVAERRAEVVRRHRELESRYSEHLASFPLERRSLLQSALPADKNAALLRDCVQTATEFQETLAAHQEIERICPGLTRDRSFISVFVKEGVDVEACRRGLPEFFRGYMIRLHGGVAP